MDPDQLSLYQSILILPVVGLTLLTREINWLLVFLGGEVLVLVFVMRTQFFQSDGRLGWANLITLSRLIALLAITYYIDNLPAVVVSSSLLAILVSDKLDGIVARHFDQETKLGGVLDIETDAAYTLILVFVYLLEDMVIDVLIVVGVLRYIYVILLELFELSSKPHKRQLLSATVSTVFSTILALYWYLQWPILPFLLLLVGIGIGVTFIRDFLYRIR